MKDIIYHHIRRNNKLVGTVAVDRNFQVGVSIIHPKDAGTATREVGRFLAKNKIGEDIPKPTRKINHEPLAKIIDSEVEKAVNSAVKYFTPKKRNVEVGQRYLDTYFDMEYVLARITENTYALISINSGNRYEDPVEDINNVFGADREDFELCEQN